MLCTLAKSNSAFTLSRSLVSLDGFKSTLPALIISIQIILQYIEKLRIWKSPRVKEHSSGLELT